MDAQRKKITNKIEQWEKEEATKQWKKPPCDFKYRIVGVLRSNQVNKGTKIDLQVVQWDKHRPTLEKRIISLLTSGAIRFKKAIGLNKEDVELIAENKEKLIEWLSDWQKDEQKSDSQNIVSERN